MIYLQILYCLYMACYGVGLRHLVIITLAQLLAVIGYVQSTNLTFMFVTSFGQFGLNSSGVVPAAEMAIRDINSRSGLLPGYTLAYDSVGDSQVGSIYACVHVVCSTKAHTQLPSWAWSGSHLRYSGICTPN